MDGNGRWAASHGMSRSEGHRAGTENLRRIIEAFIRRGVRYLTLFAFSTENWHRPDGEVRALLEIVDEVIRAEVDELHREDVRLRHIGRLDRLPMELRRSICESIELTRHNSRMTLCVAFDYGGRAEIVDAVRSMIADEVKAEDVSEELLRQYMYTNEMPDPDLIIRTSGEQRLSNFLIWQSAYAEYYTTPVYWPDFDEVEVDKAIEAFGVRKRRFGNVR
jgi:undecaprenyl diphosphate synthase